MAAADAEIEASFRWTNEELAQSRERDRAATLTAMEPGRRKLAERQKAYREANKDKLAERQRAYREANRDKLAERQKVIRDARRARGLRQDDLARLLGVSCATVAIWETGAVPADWDKLLQVLPEIKGAAPSGSNTEDGTR